MKIVRRKRFHAEVGVSAMNDIMFFLMLFFLIISTVVNPNVIKVALPKSSASENLTKQQIVLTITASKVYYIDGKEIAFSSLGDALQSRAAGLKEPTVVVRADASLTVQDLIDVMELGVRNKLKMILSTKGRK